MAEVRDRGDYPDIYVDGFQISGNPAACTLTLLRTQPTSAPGPHEDPSLVVGRVRMSTLVAQELTQALNQTLAGIATMQPAAKEGPKN
jgi:hypothetical protein